MELNERLAQLRKEHGLSQNDLADQLKVSRQAVSRWEQGLAMPSSDNLIYLSRLYGITLDELVCGKEDTDDIRIARAEENTEISVQEESSGTRAQKRPWYKLWWIYLFFGVLVLGVLIFVLAGQIDKSDAINFENLEEKILDLTSTEYFSWDDDR